MNGYSLSLDYRVMERNEPALLEFLHRLTTEVVLPAGGRFYPAKDSLMDVESAGAVFGADAVARFLTLKRRYDPGEVLQSELYRRALAQS